MIVHETPTSSNIAKIVYDEENSSMDIFFKSGRTYRYEQIPYEVWNAFVEAPSAGKFYSSSIKGTFNGVEL